MRNSERLQAQRKGELAAARELRRLNIDLTQAVNIFDVITRKQLWLFFKPLDGPLGVYFPGGILINTKRSLGVQRLTAAHEYGHHILEHQVSVDGMDNITDPSVKEVNEIEAQAFATDFLMPINLVNFLWKKFDYPPKISSFHAYLLSLHLGTSYQATVYQLIAQKKISSAEGQRFLKVPPQKIKQQIGRGIGPRNSWAEVWPIGKQDSGTSIYVAINDELRIQLSESPSTGYLWSRPQDRSKNRILDITDTEDQPASEATLSLIGSEFDPIDRRLISAGTGGDGNRYITLRAMKHGAAEVEIPLARPWLRDVEPVEKFTLRVNVAEKANQILQRIQEAL